MKTITTILLIICSLNLFGQKIKTANLKPCDTGKATAIFMIDTVPCLVPVIHDDKLTGYTEQIFRDYRTTSYTMLTQPIFNLVANMPLHYEWIQFEYPNRPHWSIDNPDTSKDKYVIHIKRKYVRWLNDSKWFMLIQKNKATN
jgi:hypothetical protein